MIVIRLTTNMSPRVVWHKFDDDDYLYVCGLRVYIKIRTCLHIYVCNMVDNIMRVCVCVRARVTMRICTFTPVYIVVVYIILF